MASPTEILLKNINNDPKRTPLRVINTDGTNDEVIKSNGSTNVNPISDYMVAVACGLIPGHAILEAIGERESFGTTVSGEDIWRGNELTPAPTSHVLIPTPSEDGEQMTVVSESGNDIVTTGSGIRIVRINYIDASGDEISENINMNGTNPVNTVATDIRFVNDIHAFSVGSGGVADGHVKIYKTGSIGLVYSMIALGGNRSLVTNRMVPAGKKLVLRWWHAEEAQNKRCAIRIRSTDYNGILRSGIFLFDDVAYLKQSTSGNLNLAIVSPAFSIIKVSGWAIIANSEVSCGWTGVLIDI